MIRISHRSLEWIRRDPRRILRLGTGGSWNTTTTLYRAVRKFHEDNDVAAFDQLEATIAAHGQNPTPELGLLETYINSFAAQGSTWFESEHRVDLSLGPGVSLAGVIDRLDLRPDGDYAVWLFARAPKPRYWRARLSMPLLQRYVADQLGTPSRRISVGFYWFEPDEHSETTYTTPEIRTAVAQARLLAVDIARVIEVHET